MADYTFAQLEALWIEAGGPKAVAPVAAAIARAESSGNPNAINPTDNNGTQTSWGLWQISNSTHNKPVPNVLDPLENAKLAVAKYNAAGGTFAHDWGTYTSGAYTQFLPKGYVPPTPFNDPGVAPLQGGKPVSGGGGESIFGLITHIGESVGGLITKPIGVAEGVSSIAHDFGLLSSTLNTLATDALWLFKPGNWVRIAAFGFGIMFLLPGIWMLSKAGSGEGDISLALGILLVMVASMLLWVAFHNLPDNVTSISELMGHLSDTIRSNSPATTG